MAQKILVTGFGPFGEIQDNPSEQLAKTFAQQSSGSIHLELLPVCSLQAPKILEEAITRTQPDLIVALGVAHNRDRIEIERVALNLLDFRIPDISSQKPQDQEIVLGGPPALFTDLPVKQACAQVIEAGIDCAVSLSAGSYVCNQIMYLCQLWGRQTGRFSSTFIHIPHFAKVPLDRQLQAIEICITCFAAAGTEASLQAVHGTEKHP